MKTLLSLVTLTTALGVSVKAQAAKFDPPDLTYEQELHRQYLRSRGLAEAPSSRTRDSYIESYRIQSGETLWSLSQTFYGDGHYWPRVWAQNQGITNPHLIRPGHNLQFLLGSEDETPSFRVTEDDDQGVELAASTNANPLIDIPPPEIPPKALIKVPKSFPEWQSVFKQMPVQITDEKGLLKQRTPLVGKTYLTAFVQEERLEPAGTFMETDLESSLPVVNQYVYVKLKKGNGGGGQKMLIVRDAGRIRRLNKQTEMENRPYLIQIAGELELSEKVEAEDDEEYDVYRALITKTFALAGELAETVGLIPGAAQEVILSEHGESGSASAQIIGSSKAVSSGLFGAGDIVFLNKGSTAGIAPNQIYDIFGDRTIRKSKTTVRFSPASSGKLRVVRVSETLATAVILQARDGVFPGDQIRQVSARAGDRELLEFHDDGGGMKSNEDDIEGDIDSDGLEAIEPSGGGDGAVDDSEFDGEL